jgi:hypothetical protein
VSVGLSLDFGLAASHPGDDLGVRAPFVNAYSRRRYDCRDIRPLRTVRDNDNARAGPNRRHGSGCHKCNRIGNERGTGDRENSAASSGRCGVVSGVRCFTYGKRLNERRSDRLKI